MSSKEVGEEIKHVDESSVHEDHAHMYKLLQTFSFYDAHRNIMSLKYDKTDKFVALGWDDGQVNIVNIETKEITKMLGRSSKKHTFLKPITCLGWKPYSSLSEVQGILTVGSWAGEIIHLHPETNTVLDKFCEEDENEVYCLDYDKSGNHLATGGKDHIIRIYDETVNEISIRLTGVFDEHHGHANRIFSLRFSPTDSNILLSGGWDNNIFVWDIRKEAPITHILGPNITGDWIDIHGDRILAGSFSNVDNLCLISMKNSKIDYQINWYDSDKYKSSKLEPPCIYAASYTKPDADFIVAGGTSRDEVRVFKNSENYDEIKGIASIANLKGACITIDCAHTRNEFAFGCSDGLAKGYLIQDIDN